MDRLRKRIDDTTEELLLAHSALRMKSERLEQVEVELNKLKQTEILALELNVGVNNFADLPLPVDSETATRAAQRVAEILRAKDEALRATQSDIEEKVNFIIRIGSELDMAKEEVIKARVAAGHYRAEVEGAVQNAELQGKAEHQKTERKLRIYQKDLHEARHTVKNLKDDLMERMTTIVRLELEVETVQEDMDEMRLKLDLEKEERGAEVDNWKHQMKIKEKDLRIRVRELEAENQYLHDKLRDQEHDTEKGEEKKD